MTTKILYFCLGALFSALASYKYFISIDKTYKSASETKLKSDLLLYKAIYTDDAHQLITNNLDIILNFEKIPKGNIRSETSRALMSSTILLNHMTMQDSDVQDRIFISAAFFIKKLDNIKTEQEKISWLSDLCKSTFIAINCEDEKTIYKFMETIN